ncbi:hypothetical protein [Fluviicola sp.]|uniref:hypothetical protein n=1 Tax=Fluviicola sp. TaxID=1917219 RepID=UPI0031D8DADB
MEQIIFSFMKNRKNEENPQVIKANASDIKKRINANCTKTPLKLDFKRTGVSPTTNTRSVELDYYNRPISSTTWSYNQQKSEFTYQVIHTKSYYIVEGKRLGITDAEIFKTFTKLVYSLQEINEFTHRTEFDKYLFDCYLEVLEEEEAERISYHNASLLDKVKMSNSTPRLILQSLEEVAKRIKTKDSELRELDRELKNRQITGANFDLLRDPIDSSLNGLRKEQANLLAKYKRMVETTKYRRRHFLKMAFKTTKRSLGHTSYKPVECGTISLCKFYIEEYCSWFNRTFKAEIAEARKLEKSAKSKQKRLANKEPDPRLEVLRPFLNSGLSKQRIADQTGIPTSTVRRLMEKLA